MRKLGKNIYYRTRKLTRRFQDFRGRNNRRQILFNASGSLSRVSSRPRWIGEQFRRGHRENVEVSHCWAKSYRRRRGMIPAEGERDKETPEPDVVASAKKREGWRVRRVKCHRGIREDDLEKASRSEPSVPSAGTHGRSTISSGYISGGCLLTLNSPPQPSSSSKRYPSIAGPLCPAQPMIPWPGGGCQATVTLLFSALHSSGISKGAPGAGNAYVKTV